MPSTATDRLQGLTTSVAVKAPCVVAATTNLTLSGEQLVAGVPVLAGDRVLLTAQANPVDNGPYVADTGPWARALDFDGMHDAVKGTLVLAGTAVPSAWQYWVVSSASPVVPGTSAITFERVDYQELALRSDLEQVFIAPALYGAAGDGLLDDGPEFLAGLVQAQANGVPYVLRHGATYLLSTWTAYSNTAKLTIIGNGATIKGPAAATNFLSPAADFDIQGVTFDRWSAAVERLSGQSSSIDEFRLYRNTFKNCTGQVVNIERPVNEYWVESNRWESCSGGYGLRIGTNVYAIQDTWRKAQITGNVFKSLTAPGSVSCAAMLIYGKEAHISGNIIDGVAGLDGESWGIYTKVRHGVISGNIIGNVKSTGTSTEAIGINLKGAIRSVTASPQGFQLQCFGNDIREIGQAGVFGAGIRMQTDDISCVANTVENGGQTGIETDDTNGNVNHIIALNRVLFENDAGTYGIRVIGNGARFKITENMVANASIGIQVFPAVAGYDGMDIVDNQLEVTSAGISIRHDEPITHLKVKDNHVLGAPTYGFYSDGGGGGMAGVEMIDNDWSAGAIPVGGVALPASAVIRGNTGYFKGSAVYDPPSLAGDASQTTTVTVAGADVSDVVAAITFSIGNAGILWVGYVTALNTVTVTMWNRTGAPIDLGSGTLSVRVQRGI